MMSLSVLDIETMHMQYPVELPAQTHFSGDLDVAFQELGISSDVLTDISTTPVTEVKPITPELTVEQLARPTMDEVLAVEAKGMRIYNASHIVAFAVFAAGIRLVTQYTSTTKPTLENFINITYPTLSYFSIAFAGAKIRDRYFKKAESKFLQRLDSIDELERINSAPTFAPPFAPPVAGTAVLETAVYETVTKDLPHHSKFHKDDIPAQRRETRERMQAAIENSVANGTKPHFDFMTRTVRKKLEEEYKQAGLDVAERLAKYDEVMVQKRNTMLENKAKNEQGSVALSTETKVEIADTEDKDLGLLKIALSGKLKQPMPPYFKPEYSIQRTRSK